MDVSKVTAALNEATTQLNAITDEEFKARRLAALRPLTLAANAIELAQKHLSTAADRTKAKDVPAGEGAGAAAGAGEGKPSRRTSAAK